MIDLKEFLEEKYHKYNNENFIETDPIQIPHLFENKYDIEIAAFLTSTIAWGKRQMIIKNGYKLMQIMQNSPYDFIINSEDIEIQELNNFVHRTFNNVDLFFFIKALKNIYTKHKSIGKIFQDSFIKHQNIKNCISDFRKIFFEIPHPQHACKHISNVDKNSAAKRLNMFIMWLVRKDKNNVHFGLWDKIPTNALKIPLDVHVGNVSRKLGLLNRKQNDWKAVEELTDNLKKYDPNDPVKYDFALFGTGIIEKL